MVLLTLQHCELNVLIAHLVHFPAVTLFLFTVQAIDRLTRSVLNNIELNQ